MGLNKPRLSFFFFQSVLRWSIAVSTICRHSSRIVAFLQAVARPKFRGPRSASIAQSRVWLGLPAGRFQSGGTCRNLGNRSSQPPVSVYSGMASTLSSVSAVLMQLAGEVVCLHVAHWLQRFCVCAVNTGRSISDSDDERHYIAVDIGSPRH